MTTGLPWPSYVTRRPVFSPGRSACAVAGRGRLLANNHMMPREAGEAKNHLDAEEEQEEEPNSDHATVCLSPFVAHDSVPKGTDKLN